MLLFMSMFWAQANEFITNIGEPVNLESAGAWIRVFPDEQGWTAALGTNSSFYIAGLTKTGDDLEDWIMEPKEKVVEQMGLIDHAIKKCPDGSYLHFASENPADGTMNDKGHLWRYDAQFNVLSYQPFNDAIGTHAHNDPNLICSSIARGVALSIQGLDYATDFFAIDEDLKVTDVIALEPSPRANGGGSLSDDVNQVVHMVGINHGFPMRIHSYDEDWTLIDSNEVRLLDSPLRAYWAQGFLEVGDFYLIAHMGKDDAWMGADKGDVFLAVLDSGFTLVKQYRITTYEEGNSAMRPWIARRGSQLLISFDAYNMFTLVEATLNLDAFGVDPGTPDTGVSPSGTWIEEGNSERVAENCGCQGSSAAVALPVLLLCAVRRRKED